GRAGALRCWTSGCSPAPPDTPPARCSAPSTSSGSAGYGWGSPSTCTWGSASPPRRRGGAAPPCPGAARAAAGRSGLSVTAFAVGAAASAVIGGRLVTRWGRRLTVTGLTLVLLGLSATALIVRGAPPTAVGWWMAPTLLVAGIGGGWVISPNTTLTLHCVPVAMAVSAGGALQTGHRIGAAIGTAALPGIFYALLAASRRNYPQAAAITLGVAVASILVALVVAVAEWRAGERRGDSPCGPPEHIPDAA